MGRVSPLQSRTTRWRTGMDIAAHKCCRKAEAAQAGDHHVSEVLTHAVAALESLKEQRGYLGCLRVIHEVGLDAVQQVDAPIQNSSPGRKALACIGSRKGIVNLTGE